ncbi:MAG: glycine dehydrogenase subunit 2 [Ruminococcaceae bacterium]|nr:glycine dehydrogenase subunit 2 [Oscillospiraceae bacterium]
MKLIFEKSAPGRALSLLPPCDVELVALPEELVRETAPALPEMSETDISRHYTELNKNVHGVNCGFYPLGSCTMKYNPRIDEEMAALPGFTQVHPLAPAYATEGCREVLETASKYLCEIFGMDACTFQPAAGAHGEFTGILLIKQYHDARGEGAKRTKIIVPDSAHGTNPATANMCGYQVVNIPSAPNGCVDLEALKAVLGEDTAGLMLTNPNTVGIFDENILEITRLVHEAGGLCYYDGANLNAVMGVVRPGDMGFDCIHSNLHKTFATPHGGGGPGAGAVGCKAHLMPYLPKSAMMGGEGIQVRSFAGNFLVVVKALTYIMTLGQEGIPEAAKNAVLNANYLMRKIQGTFEPAFDRTCMHEFVLDLSGFKKETGVSALDVAKSLIDYGMHPPTMYFPLIVHEALMLEPTETESRETLDWAADVFRQLYELAHKDPEFMHNAPHNAQIGRPDEVRAARTPILRYQKAEA